MAIVIFQAPVLVDLIRVVDMGQGQTPRLIVEKQLPPDAMGTQGWVEVNPITRPQFEGILIAAGVVT